MLAVASPPRTNRLEDLAIRRPSIDRQAERALGDERVTSHELERRARGVGLRLVVAGGDPHLTPMLDAHLSRPENVASRVERDANAVHINRFAVGERADPAAGPQAGATDPGAFAGTEVPLRPPAGVIAVRVRDDRTLDRLPRVDVEITRFTVQAALGESEQRHAAKLVRMKLLVLGASGATGGWLTRMSA